MGQYDFNVFDFVKQVLPIDLWKPRYLAYLKALLVPCQLLVGRLSIFVQSSRRAANFTGQVIYLEHLLNDEFDNALRRIYIDDGQANILPPFIFNAIEQREQYIYNKSENQTPLYVFNRSEYFTSDDFIVFVPNVILNPTLELVLTRLVNQYRQAGKNFSIQGF